MLTFDWLATNDDMLAFHWRLLGYGPPPHTSMKSVIKCIKEEAEGRSNCARFDVVKFMQNVALLRRDRLASVSLEQTPSRVEARQGMTALVRTAAGQARHEHAVAI